MTSTTVPSTIQLRPGRLLGVLLAVVILSAARHVVPHRPGPRLR